MRILPFLFVFFGIGLSAQGLQEELGYIYVTADYMIETNRYDEAIREFTKIIAKDPSYKDAMYKRALAKSYVGAFEGSRNDLLLVFDLKGITPESLELFGKTQKNMGNVDAGQQTLATAGMLGTGSGTTKSSSRTSTSRTDDSSGNEEDSSLKKIEDKLSTILGDLLPNRDGEKTSETGNGETNRTDDRTTGTRQPEVIVEEEVVPEVDNSENEIYIDEDVTLVIKNGLGGRKILQQPNILVLSETSGTVVVDICVNENGKVSSAEYNGPASSLKTQSIISLAVRKAKEFWFQKSSADEMCGSVVYKITGSS